MTTRRYHADLGLPRDMPEPSIGRALVYTLHAHTEARKDHIERWLPVCVLTSMDIIEVELMPNGAPIKWTVRMPMVANKDLVLVITSEYLVKTVWVNRRDDTHNTLDRSKYHRPELVGVGY